MTDPKPEVRGLDIKEINCQRCRGSGSVIKVIDPYAVDPFHAYARRECPDCNGWGVQRFVVEESA